jgi:hypothetical protein
VLDPPGVVQYQGFVLDNLVEEVSQKIKTGVINWTPLPYDEK